MEAPNKKQKKGSKKVPKKQTKALGMAMDLDNDEITDAPPPTTATHPEDT